jgi:hypothetical protein
MTTTRARVLAVLAGALLPIPVLGAPVGAQPLAGEPVTAPVVGHCILERVGDQLVRCDDLTGGGATAPSSVPERR